MRFNILWPGWHTAAVIVVLKTLFKHFVIILANEHIVTIVTISMLFDDNMDVKETFLFYLN